VFKELQRIYDFGMGGGVAFGVALEGGGRLLHACDRQE
jgi:hypothetical protein